MKKLIKRITAAASAVVIGAVSCVTTWFSVPASAAAGFTWLEWLEFQSLLQGIGIGGNNSDFADSVQDWIDGIGGVEMPRDDYDGEWMTNYEYYNRLGWDEIIDWFDGLFSGDNDYTDVADVGTDVSGGDFVYDGLETYNGFFRFSKPLQFISKSYPDMKIGMFFNPSDATPYAVLVPVADSSLSPPFKIYQIIYSAKLNKYQDVSFSLDYIHLGTVNSYWYFSVFYPSKWLSPQLNYNDPCWSMSDAQDFLNVIGMDGSVVYDCIDDAVNYLNSCDPDWQPGKTGTDGFIGPVFSSPAAQELAEKTGTLTGMRLDVQTDSGAPDIDAALAGAAVDTVDDLINGVATGKIPMSQVYADARVVPYVLTDVDTGEIVTDLNVSATDAKTKAVALDKDLAIPKDISAADAYQITGKTWDPSLKKYKLPLFEFFPFCLPYDAYQFLTMLDVTPVAPKWELDTTPLFSHAPFFRASDGYTITLDLTKYEQIFEIIRAGECLAIVVGFCLVSYKLIHGGD